MSRILIQNHADEAKLLCGHDNVKVTGLRLSALDPDAAVGHVVVPALFGLVRGIPHDEARQLAIRQSAPVSSLFLADKTQEELLHGILILAFPVEVQGLS